MMDYLYYLFLGFVQGVTEFLPISSSGHLVLIEKISSAEFPSALVIILAHLGTLLAVVVYFGKDVFRLLGSLFSFWKYFKENDYNEQEKQNHHYLMAIIVATIPTGIIGCLLQANFEKSLELVSCASIGFFITSLVLFVSRFAPRDRGGQISLFVAFITGVVQVLAILPGVSRSGLTIVFLLFCGIGFREAFRFSFFISMPVILGASLLKVDDMLVVSNRQGSFALLLLFLSAAFFGYVALYLFEKTLHLYRYANYTFVLAIFSLLWYIF